MGCGTGCVLGALESAFPRAAVLGSEAHMEGLGYAARRLRRSGLLQMDAANIPFRDEFDVVGCFDVLEHIEDDRRVLEQCFLAARSGVVLTVPQHSFLWSASDEYAKHVRRYTRSELIGKVKAAGFQPLLVTSFRRVALPAPRCRTLQPSADGSPVTIRMPSCRWAPLPTCCWRERWTSSAS